MWSIGYNFNDYYMLLSLFDLVRVYLIDKRECFDIYRDVGLLIWLNYVIVYLYLL